MSAFPINQEALNRYRRIRDNNNAAADEFSHCEFFNQGFSDDASWISAASSSVLTTATHGSSNTPSVSPRPRSPTRRRVSKFIGEQNMKSLKDKSPNSVDPTLRSQEWVGGHTPYGYKKPKRTWKLKNPSDEIYFPKL
mmetsp:Transcript_33583/g.81369  ORF Transcript_33583/g.81369 Transcript_33583/m.81369 type:complete len:138 (+) Transcript_33583:458-871(+)|eukprot:CAMPEP_0113639402 /NCGR_PEP_ID=MMETSP0017_2-20120614/20668_1 /TAXON_ID=2856 /ORGANISM="Cylindrotheca closterium" /LENGTH=137 /DNA_ID=CAMNT_0000550609 /DNA_START=897 /DNA_END=1310 /DNA_ORIENTATION=+ /assembly_acc=CAM_ASM_000147